MAAVLKKEKKVKLCVDKHDLFEAIQARQQPEAIQMKENLGRVQNSHEEVWENE